MSAIIGIYHLDGCPVQRTNLQRMVDRVAPWPADATGIWSHDSIGFGHRMRHVTPESLHEKLPLVSPEGYVLTADARIDNREDLLSQFGFNGRPPAGIADSELILCAYRKWGEDCPDKLIGDFAFAIWDPRERKIFCARDPMGIKPFYYHHSSKGFCFGSNIRSILANQDVSRKLDEVKIAYDLSGIYNDTIRTLYREISRLPGGHCLTVNAHHFRKRLYWDPDVSREIHYRSNREYAEAFREIFVEAVRCRLRCVHPVGSMLSGGIDSSSITCAARNIMQKKGGPSFHSFSAIFPDAALLDPRIDERKYIQAVTSGNSLVHHDVQADQTNPFLEFLWNSEEMISFPNSYLEWLLYRAARENGVGVLLSGVDGDTVVTHGYDLLSELFRKGRWLKLCHETKALSKQVNWPAWSIFKFYALKPAIPDVIKDLWRGLHGRKKPGWTDGKIINKNFADRIGLENHLKDILESAAKPANSFKEAHKLDIMSGFFTNAVESTRMIADKASLEIGFPFFDRRLIDFCLRLPLSQKLQNGLERFILRQAMADVLPPLIKHRPYKGNLSASFNLSLMKHEEKNIERLIGNRQHGVFNYVDHGKLSKDFEIYRHNPLKSDREALNIFCAIILSSWLDGNLILGE